MKHKTASLILLSFIIVASCKKDVKTSPTVSGKTTTSTSSSPYVNLQIGNYWVYNLYSRDTSGNDVFMNQTDSVFIEKDSSINGKLCYYIKHTYLPVGGIHVNYNFGYVSDSTMFWSEISTKEKSFNAAFLNDTIFTDSVTSNQVILYTVPTSFTNDTFLIGTHSGVAVNIRMRYKQANPYNGNPFNVTYEKFVPNIGLCEFKQGFVSGPVRSGFVWKLVRYHI